MNQAKIRLSLKEKELINNAEWILTKNLIIEKIILFFSALQQGQKKILRRHPQLDSSWIESAPKISKGENYQGLPYVMLDYPRVFGKQEFAAIRTMFWWGNFFSVTLHINGELKKKLEPKIISSLLKLQQKGWYCCINKNEWEHHFEQDNYCPISQMDVTAFKSRIKENEFIKIAARFAITPLENKEDELLAVFALMTELLAD
jgi:hypothetical protein